MPSGNKKEEAQELERLLKEGAFAMLDNNDSREFSEATIEHILSTRSREIVYKDGEADGFVSSANTSSKHTFTSAEADTTIDVDDPNFWNDTSNAQLIMRDKKKLEKALGMLKSIENEKTILNINNRKKQKIMKT